jgi:hypothetical protein
MSGFLNSEFSLDVNRYGPYSFLGPQVATPLDRVSKPMLGLRVEEEHESSGLDFAQHHEPG